MRRDNVGAFTEAKRCKIPVRRPVECNIAITRITLCWGEPVEPHSCFVNVWTRRHSEPPVNATWRPLRQIEEGWRRSRTCACAFALLRRPLCDAFKSDVRRWRLVRACSGCRRAYVFAKTNAWHNLTRCREAAWTSSRWCASQPDPRKAVVVFGKRDV
jgi:hypothetical protein